jgi:aminoglycoside phosphotransferase (APT) family kinase protein
LIETETFNPNDRRAECEAYLSRSLGSPVRLLQAEPLAKSTRDAPWRLDVDVDGLRRSYVLRLDPRRGEHEYAVLRAMESIPIPTPRAYGWDPTGQAFGHCFFYDFLEGESLLGPVLAGERWAEDLYIDTVCALQAVSREQLPSIADRLAEELTAEAALAAAHDHFRANPHPLADAVYARLRATQPIPPPPRFSNGDLWLDNLIVRDRRLVGVIDFEGAGFSDPIFEFLLSFFVSPELRGRGTEERYCRRMGFDPALLPWYRGLEVFDTWRWVMATGRPFVHYTAENLAEALEDWLSHDPVDARD